MGTRSASGSRRNHDAWARQWAHDDQSWGNAAKRGASGTSRRDHALDARRPRVGRVGGKREWAAAILRPEADRKVGCGSTPQDAARQERGGLPQG